MRGERATRINGILKFAMDQTYIQHRQTSKVDEMATTRFMNMRHRNSIPNV